MQSVTVSGGNSFGGVFTYYYDAFNRRIQKHTPWSSMDEYFYDTGHQVLSDRGGNTVGSAPTEYPEDDYIWLGGRPVAIIRGKFSTGWARTVDANSGYYCARNGQSDACGGYFPVTDYLGKPVLVLDQYAGRTSGSTRYEAFGHSNRREARWASPHNQVASGTVTTLNENLPVGFDGWARVLFNKTSLRKTAKIYLDGVQQPFSPPSYFPNSATYTYAHAFSNWQLRSSTGWVLSYVSTTSGSYGFDMEAYEFRFKEVNANWFWPPLRFPGQYHDEETDLFENWNRFYDPATGGYLQPEPATASPALAEVIALRGGALPVVAYALNNPFRVVDPSGLGPLSCGPTGCAPLSPLGEIVPSGGASSGSSAAAAAAAAAGAGAAAGEGARQGYFCKWFGVRCPPPSVCKDNPKEEPKPQGPHGCALVTYTDTICAYACTNLPAILPVPRVPGQPCPQFFASPP